MADAEIDEAKIRVDIRRVAQSAAVALPLVIVLGPSLMHFLTASWNSEEFPDALAGLSVEGDEPAATPWSPPDMPTMTIPMASSSQRGGRIILACNRQAVADRHALKLLAGLFIERDDMRVGGARKTPCRRPPRRP
jgi:hypothetical protein